MSEPSGDQIVGQLLAVLREGFEGPAERWSYFTDRGPEAGFFGTLAAVNAAEASHATGDTSIAAHVHHVVFALEASTAWIRGDRAPRTWNDSWRVSAVDEHGWTELQERLRDEYDGLRATVERHALDGVEAFGGAVAAVAHAAYHLGAVRQKIVVTRAATT